MIRKRKVEIDINEDRIDHLYSEAVQMLEKFAVKYNAMEIAAVMVNLGMTIYKTSLNEEDYQSMISAIYDTRDVVKPFNLNEGVTIQ